MSTTIAIGINGGHIRSSATAVCLESNEILARIRGDCLNPHALGESDLFSRSENLALHLFDHLKSARSISPCDIGAIVVSLPGVAVDNEQEHLQHLMRRAFNFKTTNVIDDTWAALYAATRRPFGVCAFAGCGASVCIAPGRFIPKKTYKIDGWGPVIGDFGSGFQITTRFFRRLGRDLDKSGCSECFDRVRASKKGTEIYPELPPIEYVQRWFDKFVAYHGAEWRAQFATLAEPLLQLADSDENDPGTQHAKDLIVSVAEDMVYSLTIAAQRCPEINEMQLPLILQGGVLRNSACYQQVIKNKVGHLFDKVEVSKDGPVIGAMWLAADSMKQNESLLF